jgi:hypothetical protein
MRIREMKKTRLWLGRAARRRQPAASVARDPRAGSRRPSLEKEVGLVFPAGMDCRPQCGACCVAPSISSPIPGMPHGKLLIAILFLMKDDDDASKACETVFQP